MWKESNQVTLTLAQHVVLWLCRRRASPTRALGSLASSGRREPEVWCKLQEEAAQMYVTQVPGSNVELEVP